MLNILEERKVLKTKPTPFWGAFIVVSGLWKARTRIGCALTRASSPISVSSSGREALHIQQ